MRRSFGPENREAKMQLDNRGPDRPLGFVDI